MIVHLDYFKDSGKWYGDAEMEFINWNDAIVSISGMFQSRMLPGLVHGHSELTVLAHPVGATTPILLLVCEGWTGTHSDWIDAAFMSGLTNNEAP